VGRSVIILVLGLLGSAASRASVLTGSVQDPVGNVVPKVIVLLLSESDPTARYLTHTNNRGTFGLEDVQPGRYTLQIESPGFRQYNLSKLEIGPSPKALPVIVLDLGLAECPPGTVHPVDIRLLPTGLQSGSLSGSFRLAIARPLRFRRRPPHPAEVSVELRNTKGELIRAARTTLTKGFRFADLPPGPYSIKLTGSGLYEETWPVVLRQDLEVDYAFPEEPCRESKCDPVLRYKTKDKMIVWCE
jgi:hypothetical protein